MASRQPNWGYWLGIFLLAWGVLSLGSKVFWLLVQGPHPDAAFEFGTWLAPAFFLTLGFLLWRRNRPAGR